MTRTRESLQKTLERILRARGGESGEDYVTQRNDRYVIPVRAAERRSLEGVVHASSATGQTVFIEPLETVEINNQLVHLREDEAAEIARILEELTGKLIAERGPLSHVAAAIAEMDAVFARARFAREYDACIPEFTDEATIALDGGAASGARKHAAAAGPRGGAAQSGSGQGRNGSGHQRPEHGRQDGGAENGGPGGAGRAIGNPRGRASGAAGNF